jgi:type IV pilus assembly protein PilF
MYSALTYVLLLISLVLSLQGCAGSQSASKEKAGALRNLGSSLVQEGNLRAGLEKLLEAVELDPTDSDTHHELARVYRDLEEYRLSLDHFKKALRLRPDFPEALNNMGTVYLKLRQWDPAIDCFQQAGGNLLYKTPHYAYNNLGLAYFGKGEYWKAIASYQKSLKLAPAYSPAHTNLGLALERIKRWEAAMAAYEKAIEVDPDYAPAHFNLGRLHLKFNRSAEAAEELRQTIRIDPRSPFAHEAKRLLNEIR